MSEPVVVIVGGGLAGLTAAALLGSEAVRVVVVEADADVGGRLRGLSWEGFRFDAGLHCFHYGDAGPVGVLNSRLELGLEFISSGDPGYLLRGKERLPVPSGSDTPARDVPGFTAAEAARIQEWFARLMEVKAKDWLKRSVLEFVVEAGFEGDELVSGYAGALCLSVLGRSVAEVSAGVLAAHAQAVGHSGFHVATVAGGPGRMVEGLLGRLDPERTKMAVGVRAQEMTVEDERVTRVITSSDVFAPDAVIYTGPPQALPGLLPVEALSAKFAAACGKLMPVAGIVLELALGSRVTEVAGTMMDPAEAVIGRFPSNLDPTLAPAGGQLASWLALVDPQDLEDKKTIRTHIMRMKRIVKRQFPDLFEHVRMERLRVVPAVAGAAPLPKQTDRKIKVEVKGLTNLFLAGDGVSAGGLLSGGAVKSALEAVEKVKILLKSDQPDPP